MDGVPVKISERCRPPGKVHLPASLRTLPPSESPAEPISFELEKSALHWVQERRRNLLSERDGRRARLELKDEAKRRRQAEQAEQLRREEQRQEARRAEEAAQRLVEEEEQMRREEERRLEEFRSQRQQTGTPETAETESAATITAAPAPPPESAPAPTPTPTPVPASTPISISSAVDSSSSSSAVVSDTSSICAPASAAAHDSVSAPSSRSPAAVPSATPPSQGAPPSRTMAECRSEASAPHPAAAPADVSQSASPAAASGWSANAVSSNPFNPFSGPSAAVMKPQAWQQQQQQHADGTTATPSGGFNYHDFESQASDPFDSVELKTINDMEELASVFRPPPAMSAAAAAAPVSAASSQPQPAYSYRHPQQQQGGHHHHQQQQYYSSAAVSTAGPSRPASGRGSGYSLPGGYTPYPAPGYGQPTYTSIPNKSQSADQPAYRYPGGGYVYTSAGGRASLLSDSSASRATVTPGGPAAAPPQPDARQLQEFYTRYYATPGRASPGLRSSRSEPDLSEPILATGGSDGQDADNGAARRTKSHTPPPAACGATLPAAQVWVPRPEPAAEPADPLHGLDPAVRSRLQELGQMGFPLDRLRRLHSQFNGDEKQVIEFCLSAQRLEEAGHQPLAAERGLLECDGDLGRAADFLSSLAQLTGLGFPEPRAADALRRSDMHRDRALDLLIQG